MSVGNIVVKGKIFLSRTRAQKEGRVIQGGLHSYNQDKMTSERIYLPPDIAPPMPKCMGDRVEKMYTGTCSSEH